MKRTDITDVDVRASEAQNKPSLEECNINKITNIAYLKLFQKIKNFYPDLIDRIANHKLTYENL